MEDSQIIRLYFERDEAAISETDAKYGPFCRKIACRILADADAEECVNDAYFRAWNAIPPQKPEKLGAWLGRVVRNLALDLWKKNHRQKRYGLEQLLSELEECIPSHVTVEHEIEGKEVTRILNEWLASLSKKDRVSFVRRYWYGEMVNALAEEQGISPANMAKRLYRLRKSLKARLEEEGYL